MLVYWSSIYLSVYPFIPKLTPQRCYGRLVWSRSNSRCWFLLLNSFMAWVQAIWRTVSPQRNWPTTLMLAEKVCYGPWQLRNSSWERPGQKPFLPSLLPLEHYATTPLPKVRSTHPFWPPKGPEDLALPAGLEPYWGCIILLEVNRQTYDPTYAFCSLPPSLLILSYL